MVKPSVSPVNEPPGVVLPDAATLAETSMRSPDLITVLLGHGGIVTGFRHNCGASPTALICAVAVTGPPIPTGLTMKVGC